MVVLFSNATVHLRLMIGNSVAGKDANRLFVPDIRNPNYETYLRIFEFKRAWIW